MARRTPSGKVSLTDVLPIWTTKHSDTVNLVAASIFWGHGITDVSSYFQKLRIPVVICAILGALFCASSHGLTGFILGGLAGFAAPAVLLWLGVVLVGIVIYLAAYLAAWAVILYGLWWLVTWVFS